MSISSANSAGTATRRVETLTSGTSWTVPAKVLYVNATLIGAGGSGGRPDNSTNSPNSSMGAGGQMITTTVTTTPGASIAYGIGAGGTIGAGNDGAGGGSGGSTTFTDATTAVGGGGGGKGSNGSSPTPSAGLSAPNGGLDTGYAGQPGNGGAGQIILEYWIS